MGVAFGSSSDITAENAEAVLLNSFLQMVDKFLLIGRRLRPVALQCAVGGMILSFGALIAAASGLLPPVADAMLHELIDVIVIP